MQNNANPLASQDYLGKIELHGICLDTKAIPNMPKLRRIRLFYTATNQIKYKKIRVGFLKKYFGKHWD